MNKSASRRSLTSNLKQVDAHNIAPHEYEELPEFTEDMLARAKLKKGGRPLSASPQIHFLAPAPRSHRALASHRPWLADPHGRAVEQGLKIGGASHKIECEQEVDGRWLAEVIELPGVLTDGTTKNEANQYSAQ